MPMFGTVLAFDFGYMPMTGEVAMGKLWQTDVIKITKEIRLLLKQNK